MTPNRWWQALYGVAGACVFIVLNALMWLSDHPFMQEGAQLATPGEWTPVLLVIAFVLLLLAAIGQHGRSFGVGFVAALTILTVASIGTCTRTWADPVRYLQRYQREAAATSRNRAGLIAADRKWRDSLRTAGMWRSWGATRTLLIGSCIETYRKRDATRRLPPDSATITNQGNGCRDWDAFQGRRSGWNWRYVPSSTSPGGFVVESYPDPAIGLEGPLYRIDESGLLVERERSGVSAMLVTSPVAAMHTLQACIRQALALPRSRRSASATALTLEAIRNLPGSPCPSLGSVAYGGLGAGDSNAAMIRLPQDAPPKDKVTSYTLFYVPRDRTDRAFDVLARPQTYAGNGVRSYLLTGSGQLHVTTEERAATSADPAPQPCEVDLKTPCKAAKF
jgi:hypothetical protein